MAIAAQFNGKVGGEGASSSGETRVLIGMKLERTQRIQDLKREYFIRLQDGESEAGIQVEEISTMTGKGISSFIARLTSVQESIKGRC